MAESNICSHTEPQNGSVSLPRLVVVLGTNSSGKSALGVELARAFGGEVVSADSRQVYRRLDLGTGKVAVTAAIGSTLLRSQGSSRPWQ